MKIDLSHIEAVHWNEVPVGSLVKYDSIAGVYAMKVGNTSILRIGTSGLVKQGTVSKKDSWKILTPSLGKLLHRTFE